MSGKNRKKSDLMDLSIVIPSYNSEHLLYGCLDSIYAMELSLNFEIVIVDSSPVDPASFIHTRFPDVRVIHLKQRTLPGKARSRGAREALGEIVIFTDSDCLVDTLWVEEHLKYHDKGYKVVGGSVANGTPESYVGTSEYLLEFNEVNPWYHAREIRTHPSCNLSVKKEIFSLVGYFPDFMKSEDTLFCENITQAGEKIYFNPQAIITHLNRTGFVHYMKNSIALGEGSREARRRARLHGHYLTKYPFLVGFIPVYRTIFIGKRLLQSNMKLFWSYLKHYPFIFLGMMAYVWGFIRGPYRSGLSTEKQLKKGIHS